MKGLFRAGCVALILGVLVFAGRSSSEPDKRPEPRTRVGLINLAYVFKNYKKVDLYKKVINEELAQRDKEFKKQRDEMQRITRELVENTVLPDEAREALKKQLKKLEREQDESLNKAKETISETNDKQLVAVYTDVRKAVERYAKAHSLDIVLHCIDATTDTDLDNPINIKGKVQQRACIPLYVTPGIDITKEIVTMLNNDWHEEKAPPADKQARVN